MASVIMGGPIFKIKSYIEDYTYERKHNNKQDSAKWIAEKWDDVIRGDSSLSIKTLDDMARRYFRVKISFYTLYKARKVALYGLRKEYVMD